MFEEPFDIIRIFKDKSLFEIISSGELHQKIAPLKWIFIAISFIFFILVIFFIKKSSWLGIAYLEDYQDYKSFKDFGSKKLNRVWEKIKIGIESESEAQQKLSLIEAYKLLDEVLAMMGHGEKTLEEKLKKLTEKDISNLSELFRAYQVCQDIIHDPDLKISKEKAQEVINIFEKAFKDLQVF